MPATRITANEREPSAGPLPSRLASPWGIDRGIHRARGPTRHAYVYLASQSPRRRQLLDQLGVAYQLLLADAGEDAEVLEAVHPGELPAVYVQRVTALKLAAACARHARRALPAAPILCADTTVAIGRQILGKPADAAQARQMLQRLSGRSHRVLTAIALHDGKRSHHALQVSQVRFAALDDALIERYIASGEPFGKAGAYAVQSALAGWISHIAGSYSGVMGLPLHETAQLLRQAGVQMTLA